MCSARSVSTRSMPASASACGRPISSPSIDFARVTLRGVGLAADPHDDGAGLGGAARPVDLGARGDGVAFEGLEVVVEMGDHVVLDRLARARAPPRTRGRRRPPRPRLRSAVPVVRSIATLSVASASAASARALKLWCAAHSSALLADRRAVGHAGHHLDRVIAAHRRPAAVAACPPCSSGSRGRRRAAARRRSARSPRPSPRRSRSRWRDT